MNEIQNNDLYYTVTLMENRFLKGAMLGAAFGGCLVFIGVLVFGGNKKEARYARQRWNRP